MTVKHLDYLVFLRILKKLFVRTCYLGCGEISQCSFNYIQAHLFSYRFFFVDIKFDRNVQHTTLNVGERVGVDW